MMQQAQPPFQRIWRDQGEPPRRATFATADELTPWNGRDLDILIAPLDGKFSGTEAQYEKLIELYKIPDEFVWERESGVTHSFGRHLGFGGLETLWMHFLAATPMMDSPDRQPEWLKWGLVLKWLPKLGLGPGGVPRTTYTVALILFKPPVETMERLVDFVLSLNWTDAAVDPYVLVDIALVSWYHRIDEVAWEVTKLVRIDEQEVFGRTRMLDSTANMKSTVVADFDLHQIHTSAKNAVFMIEALDAAIRLVDSTLSDHEARCGTSNANNRVWLNTHRLLRHRRELFHSLRLRTVSSQARIKNTVDLVCTQPTDETTEAPLGTDESSSNCLLTEQAFHISIAHDSRVNLQNSRSVRLISIMGLIFIPFGAITTIFGTQFFDSTGDGHINLSADFWILWIIAIPVTAISLVAWRATERDDFQRPWGSALSTVPRWWMDAWKWVGRERQGGTMLDATELRDLGSQLV